jgi:hypothetical protein
MRDQRCYWLLPGLEPTGLNTRAHSLPPRPSPGYNGGVAQPRARLSLGSGAEFLDDRAAHRSAKFSSSSRTEYIPIERRIVGIFYSFRKLVTTITLPRSPVPTIFRQTKTANRPESRVGRFSQIIDPAQNVYTILKNRVDQRPNVRWAFRSPNISEGGGYGIGLTATNRNPIHNFL